MAAQRPLVESGTNGYSGNVTPILRGKTPCYECNPKVEGKTYPICTIRSTPTKMVHCVVWAKALYEVLFGPEDEFNYLHDLKSAVPAGLADPAAFWLKKLFTSDILEMQQCSKVKLHPISQPDTVSTEYLQKFRDAFAHLVADSKPSAFDKDNDRAVELVYAAANLRAQNFGIPGESQFKVKQIAGNIIAAISSTNAAVAAMQVLEAVKLTCSSPTFRTGLLTARLHWTSSPIPRLCSGFTEK